MTVFSSSEPKAPGKLIEQAVVCCRRRLSVTSTFSNDISDFVVVVALLFYVHGKHLRSCRDGQLT